LKGIIVLLEQLLDAPILSLHNFGGLISKN